MSWFLLVFICLKLECNHILIFILPKIFCWGVQTEKEKIKKLEGRHQGRRKKYQSRTKQKRDRIERGRKEEEK